MINVQDVLKSTDLLDSVPAKDGSLPAKTYFPINSKEKKLVERNYSNGMLVLDGKGPLPWEVSVILDLVIHPKTVKNYNYFEGVKPEVFAQVILNIFSGEAKDPTWNNAGYSLLYYGFVFHQAMIRLFNESKSPMAHIRTINLMAKKNDADGNHPILDKFKQNPDANIELFESGTILNDALNKFTAFNALAEETKSSVVFTVENWMNKFIQSEELRPWANSETSDFDMTEILYGKKFGVALPEFEFGDAGLAIQSLSKARLYNLIKYRGNDALKRGYSRVYLFVDECQRFLDNMDLAILPEARSLELVCCFATQNINSIYNKFQAEGTKTFMGAFASLFSYKSTPETISFVQERFGKAKVLEHKEDTSMVDSVSNAKSQMSSAFFDPTHPLRNKIRKMGFRRLKSFFNYNPVAEQLVQNREITVLEKILNTILGKRAGRGSDPSLLMSSKATLSLSDVPKYIIAEREIESLETPFVALASVQRGQVVRRAITKTVPYTNDFKVIDTSINSAIETINKYKNLGEKK